MAMPKNHNLKKERLIEASLFSAGRPISLEEIAQATGLSQKQIPACLTSLMEHYTQMGTRGETALEIGQAGDKYVMQLQAAYAHCGKKLAPMEIPEKLLGTLALIAYHQPIKQSEVRDMIGQKVYDHVGELLDLGLLTAEKMGRTKSLSTSPSFPEYFGLSTTNTEEIRVFLLEKLKHRVGKPGGNETGN
jgi:segregation and condensation protein B